MEQHGVFESTVANIVSLLCRQSLTSQGQGEITAIYAGLHWIKKNKVHIFKRVILYSRSAGLGHYKLNAGMQGWVGVGQGIVQVHRARAMWGSIRCV